MARRGRRRLRTRSWGGRRYGRRCPRGSAEEARRKVAPVMLGRRVRRGQR